jgi:phosphopantetheinyl transferase
VGLNNASTYIQVKPDLNENDHIWLTYIGHQGGISSLQHPKVKKIFSLYFADATLAFKRTPAGKPYLLSSTNSDIHFSIAHSQGFLVVALSQINVGIDLESLERARSYKKISQKYFAEEIVSLEDFYRSWTAREAFIKALGQKIATSLASTQVLISPSEFLVGNDQGLTHRADFFHWRNRLVGALCRPENCSRSWTMFEI